MKRNRNFRVHNDVVERGSVTKSHKGNKAYVERKVGECFHWKTHGPSSKGDSCSFSHDTMASGNSAQVRDEKDYRLLPHPIRSQSRLTARNTNPHSDQATKRNALQTRSEIPCVFRITSLKKDVYMVTFAISDMLRQKESPAKGQRTLVEQDRLPC